MNEQNTAYRLWVSDILNPSNKKDGGLVVSDDNIYRVNIIGTVVNSRKAEDGSFASILIDDSSGQIQVRAWKEDIGLLDFEVGQVVQIVGRLAEYNEVIYVRPEITQKIKDFNLETLHKALLLKRYGKPQIAMSSWNTTTQTTDNDSQQKEETAKEVDTETVVEEKITEEKIKENSPRKNILKLIEEMDGVEGADVGEIVQKSGMSENQVQEIMDDLLKNGEIFMLRPGRVKIL